jgi:hypothetical protein
MSTTAANCYRLTVLVNKESRSCVVDAGGRCTIVSGPGSCSANTDVYLKVERMGGAAGGSFTYTLSGHL